MQAQKFVIVGIGGYAFVHLDAVQWLQEQGLAELEGVVALKSDQERYPDLVESLKNQNVKIYADVDEFFADKNTRADVLTIPIGIHMHVPICIRALNAGLHVYCEKPLAATIQEVDQLIAAQEHSDKKVTVGFQHIYSNSMQQIKARICDGRLGKVKDISLMCGWPRSHQYYSRNDWTGHMRKDEFWILDSPANNAHSHYLLNMLYLCSSDPQTAATPVNVRAELYRANKIESPDTVQVEFKTEDGVKGNGIFSHCNSWENGPFMRIMCENGDIEWKSNIGKTLIKYKNGEVEEFDNLIHDKWVCEGFKNLVEAIEKNVEPICTPKMARCHTLTINAIHESCPSIKQVPEEDILELEDWEIFPPDTKGNFRRVKNMDDYLEQAFDQKKFLSEIGVSWAQGIESELFEINNYSYFPQNE